MATVNKHSFCLKGNENELLGPLEINYAPFINHTQSAASRTVDEEEMLRLSGKMNDNAVASSLLEDKSEDDTIKLRVLEKDYRSIKEQKEYLEELLRYRERQLGEVKLRAETARLLHNRKEMEWNQERRMLNTCVLELQSGMTSLRNHNDQLRRQIANLQQFKDRIDMPDVPLMDMANAKADPQLPGNRETASGKTLLSASGSETKSILSDQRSLQSLASDQVQLKEDSQSMTPMTGSLMGDVEWNAGKDNPSVPEQGKFGDKLQPPTAGQVIIEETDAGDEQCDSARHGIVDEMAESYVMADISTINAVPSSVLANEMKVDTDVSHLTLHQAKAQTQAVKTDTEMEQISDESQHSQIEQGNSRNDSPNMANICGQSLAVVVEEEANLKSFGDYQSQSGVASHGASSMVVEESVSEQTFSGSGTGVDVEGGKIPDVMTISDGGGSSSGADTREEEVLSSDPEILDRANTSSDGSDAAWEMLSDSEPTENAEPTQNTENSQ